MNKSSIQKYPMDEFGQLLKILAVQEQNLKLMEKFTNKCWN